MMIDNLVIDHRVLVADRSIVEVDLSAEIPGLFTNDDVEWNGRTWGVWRIDGTTLTLIDRERVNK